MQSLRRGPAIICHHKAWNQGESYCDPLRSQKCQQQPQIFQNKRYIASSGISPVDPIVDGFDVDQEMIKYLCCQGYLLCGNLQGCFGPQRPAIRTEFLKLGQCLNVKQRFSAAKRYPSTGCTVVKIMYGDFPEQLLRSIECNRSGTIPRMGIQAVTASERTSRCSNQSTNALSIQTKPQLFNTNYGMVLEEAIWIPHNPPGTILHTSPSSSDPVLSLKPKP